MTATWQVRPTPHPRTLEQRTQALADLKFGVVFTDHMAHATWTAEGGWGEHRVEAYGPLQLDPAAAVLHYAQEVFEGLKAYRHADGSVWAFRPQANAARFARSAHRLALPELSVEDFLGSVEALVRTDAEWVPDAPGSSLYLRPFMFASESFLGVRPAKTVDYLVIASPVGPYFTNGFTPLKIWVDTTYHRAGPGGTGAAKCGGNYAASLLPQQNAYAAGCDQVCFLDATTNTLVEELGGMNVFVVDAEGGVHTPEVSGSILEGVTRSAILATVADGGHEVHERPMPLAEVIEGFGSGRFTEMFACGTAAVITPIGLLKNEDFELSINGGEAGPVTQALYTELTELQYGRRPDPHGWLHRLV